MSASMRQQVLIIGGGTTFDIYEDYIFYLKNRELSLDNLKLKKDWKDTIADELGEKFDVFLPKMPNSTNASYSEWKVWLDRIVALLNENAILVGHSLGGIFLAKFLSETVVPIKIKAAILVAAPYDDTDMEESLASFRLPTSLSMFAKQCKKLYLFQSQDDPVVPFSHVQKYKQMLPGSQVIAFADRGHFKQDTFPELTELIKSI